MQLPNFSHTPTATAHRATAGNTAATPAPLATSISDAVSRHASPSTAVDFRAPEGAVRIGEMSAALPDAAREKYMALRDMEADLFALSRGPRADIDEMRDRVQFLMSELSRQKAVSPRFQNEGEIARLEAVLESARAEMQRHQARYDKAMNALAPLKRTLDRLNRYLSSASGSSPAEPVDVSIYKGKTPRDKLENARTAILELKTQRKEIEGAPNPSSYAKSQVHAFVDHFANQGEPPVKLLLETNRPLILRGAYDHATSAPVLQNFLFWLCRDEIIAKIDALVDQNAEDESALTAADRAEKLRRIDAEILKIERAEEQILCEFLASGVSVDRRSGVDPRAVLMISGSAPRD